MAKMWYDYIYYHDDDLEQCETHKIFYSRVVPFHGKYTYFQFN